MGREVVPDTMTPIPPLPRHTHTGAEVELQDAEFQLLEGFLDMQRNQNVCIVLVNDFGGLRRDIVLSITLSSDNATSECAIRDVVYLRIPMLKP